MQLRKWSSELILVLAALMIVTMAPMPSQADDTIKIGTINPMTGGLAFAGKETYAGIKIAADMQNARGGVHGKKIVLVKGDSATPKTAITEAERLINVEKINLFCGHYSSSRAKAATTITEKYGAVSVVVIALADDITGRGFKKVFQIPGRASFWGSDSAKFVAEQVAPKLGKKPSDLTIAVAHEDSDFGTSISNAFVKTAEKYGMKILAREPYSYKALDLSSVVLRIKRANADVLALTPYIRDGILFMEQARDMNLNSKAIICPGGVMANRIFYEKLGDDINYVLVTSTASLDVRKDNFKPDAWEALQEFQKRYEKAYGKMPAQDAFHGFNGAWLFFHYALPNSTSLDSDDVAKSLRKIELAPGDSVTTYGYKFADENASNPGANIIGRTNVFQWQNGTIGHTVYPPEFAGSKLLLPTPPWGKRAMK